MRDNFRREELQDGTCVEAADLLKMLGTDGDVGFVEFPTNRTCAADFYLALKAVDDLLAKYSAIKQDATGAKWRTQSVIEHLQHCYVHAIDSLEFVDPAKENYYEPDGQEEDLASTACRALMALQLYLEQKAQAQPPPPAR